MENSNENLSPEMKSFLEKVGYFNATVIKSEDVNYTLKPIQQKSNNLANNLTNNDWVKFFEKSRLAAVERDVKE
jgi:hypothetical protein